MFKELRNGYCSQILIIWFSRKNPVVFFYLVAVKTFVFILVIVALNKTYDVGQEVKVKLKQCIFKYLEHGWKNLILKLFILLQFYK